MICRQALDHFFPWMETEDADLAVNLFHDDSASRFDDQFIVRLFNGEKVLVVAKIIDPLGHDSRARYDLQFALRQALAGQRARLETCNVVADRHGISVFVSSAVNDFIDHRPMLIGSVRAWLKYRLDKLSDHEGSSRSSPPRKLSSRMRPSESLALDGSPGKL